MPGFPEAKKCRVGPAVFIPVFVKLPLLLLLFLALSFKGIADAATYYASPPGSGTTCSSSSPCTVDYAINAKAVAGDSVLLKNGTYTGSSGMVNVRKSGTSGKPITIKAENDGLAIVDGQNSRNPFYASGKSYIDVEGIIFKNSPYELINIVNCNHFNFRRVSGYNANPSINAGSIFVLSNSDYVLLEDCAASGNGKIMFDIDNGSDYVTVRRCWGMWRHSNVTPNTVFVAYGANHALFENNIATFNSTDSNPVKGFYVWANYYNNSADYNTFIGNIAYNLPYPGYYISSQQHNITGNQFINNVAINTYGGIVQRGGQNTLADHMTLIGNAYYAGAQDQMKYDPNYPTDCDFRMDLAFKNSFIGTNTTMDWQKDALQLASGCSTAYPTHSTSGTATSGMYNTSTYGKGAYLIRPTDTNGAGAEVLYRYVDGEPTSYLLWPWPMEDRICKETGYSVTYEKGYSGCPQGGGIWKTLDGLYMQTAQSAPVSSNTTTPSDTQTPTVPTNLKASVISSSQINLAWTASTDNVGVSGYKVYINGNLAATTAKTSYSDTGLSAGTTYTYRVSAFDAAGNTSAQSVAASATTPYHTSVPAPITDSQAATDTVPPSPPANLTATVVSSSQINVSWAPSTDNVGVAGYRIYRNGALIATTQSMSYSNTGLSASTTYTYTVAAYDAAGNISPMSASASATTTSAITRGKWWRSMPKSFGKK